jgi:hypothetical protein
MYLLFLGGYRKWKSFLFCFARCQYVANLYVCLYAYCKEMFLVFTMGVSNFHLPLCPCVLIYLIIVFSHVILDM